MSKDVTLEREGAVDNKPADHSLRYSSEDKIGKPKTTGI